MPHHCVPAPRTVLAHNRPLESVYEWAGTIRGLFHVQATGIRRPGSILFTMGKTNPFVMCYARYVWTPRQRCLVIAMVFTRCSENSFSGTVGRLSELGFRPSSHHGPRTALLLAVLCTGFSHVFFWIHGSLANSHVNITEFWCWFKKRLRLKLRWKITISISATSENVLPIHCAVRELNAF